MVHRSTCSSCTLGSYIQFAVVVVTSYRAFINFCEKRLSMGARSSLVIESWSHAGSTSRAVGRLKKKKMKTKSLFCRFSIPDSDGPF